MTFPTKNSVLDDFPLCPQGPPPPQNRKFYFYCRLAVSDWRSLVPQFYACSVGRKNLTSAHPSKTSLEGKDFACGKHHGRAISSPHVNLVLAEELINGTEEPPRPPHRQDRKMDWAIWTFASAAL